MDEQIVGADNSNTAEEIVETLDSTTEKAEETIDYKAKYEKALEEKENQKIRAEKAEKLAKQPKEAKLDVSTIDIIALSKANIHEDDIADVQEYAKFKGISIKDALNSSVVKATLSENAEKRNVANATNTSNVRRGPAQASDDVLLSRASKGEMPTTDADLIRLTRARKGLK
jgi:hypothetical protein